MAIKVMGVEGEKLLEAEKLEQTQDFLLINTNVFSLAEHQRVCEVHHAIREERKHARLRALAEPVASGGILYRSARVTMTNPLTTRFWSSVPIHCSAPPP